MVKFGEVGPPWWTDAPVFVICGGLSLRGKDLSNLRDVGYVLGTNRTADLVPVDATFSLDHNFMKNRAGTLTEWSRLHEVYLAVAPDYADPPLEGPTYLERRQGNVPSLDPRYITNGLNSGYGALNLALLKRSTETWLLGLDLKVPQAEEPSHWHGGYPWGNGSSHKYYSRWAARFDEFPPILPEGVRVYNANPDSAVTAFPFRTYKELCI